MDTFQISGARYNDTFICSLEGDEIIRRDAMGGETQVIGMRITAYKELEATTQEYYDKLVSLGVIIPPKTQEDIIKETQDALAASQATNTEMLALVKEMRAEMEGLKNGIKPTNSGSSKASAKPKPKPGGGADAEANKREEHNSGQL